MKLFTEAADDVTELLSTPPVTLLANDVVRLLLSSKVTMLFTPIPVKLLVGITADDTRSFLPVSVEFVANAIADELA